MHSQPGILRWPLSVPRWSSRIGGRRDLLLAGVLAAVTVAAISVADEARSKEPDAFAYALGVAAAGTLLFRRRWPLGVLLACVGLSVIYHSLNYPGGPPRPAVWAALFFAALSGRRDIALVIGLLDSGAALSYRVLIEGEHLFHISMVGDVALAFGAVMFGDAIHARRQWMAEALERQEQADRRREEEARHRVEEERLRFAHELHDILAHTLAVVNVQAGVAGDMLDHDLAATRAALDEMRRASREAMTELRATVGVLRESAAAPRAPAAGLRDLGRVIESARQAGLEVESVVEGERRRLSAAVDLAAFRVLQEAVTNVVKHAAARSMRVVVRYEPAGLALEVVDDGRGAAQGSAAGFGVTGMRERVEALDGRFETASSLGDGSVVRAWLPAEER